MYLIHSFSSLSFLCYQYLFIAIQSQSDLHIVIPIPSYLILKEPQMAMLLFINFIVVIIVRLYINVMTFLTLINKPIESVPFNYIHHCIGAHKILFLLDVKILLFIFVCVHFRYHLDIVVNNWNNLIILFINISMFSKFINPMDKLVIN